MKRKKPAFYYSPFSKFGITPEMRERILGKRENGELFDKDDWDAYALAIDCEFLDDEVDIADSGILADLEKGARKHGSAFCGAALGAAILAAFTRREVVSDAISWLERSFHQGVKSAAFTLAAWYSDRAKLRDLRDFEDVDLPIPRCYEPSDGHPIVEFPANRAECTRRGLFWALAGLVEEIDDCEGILAEFDDSDDLTKEFEELFRKAADAGGCPVAQKRLAVFLMRGGAGKDDRAKAVSLLRSAAKSGKPGDLFLLALALKETLEELHASTPEEIFGLCLEAANKGLPEAMLQVALFYGDGFGTEQDRATASEWMEKAADEGEGNACLVVGKLLLDLAKTPKEKREAVSMIRFAAEEKDIAGAWAELATAYETGVGLYVNRKKAAACLKRAKEIGWEPPKDGDPGQAATPDRP